MDPAAYAAVRTGTDVVAKQAHVGGSFLAGEVPDRAYAEGWVPPGQIRVDDYILSTEPLNSWKALRLQKDLFGGGSEAESAKKKHLARLRQERAVLRTFLGDLLEHEQKQLGALVLAKLDVIWRRERYLLQHLLATNAYLQGVAQCEQACAWRART